MKGILSLVVLVAILGMVVWLFQPAPVERVETSPVEQVKEVEVAVAEPEPPPPAPEQPTPEPAPMEEGEPKPVEEVPSEPEPEPETEEPGPPELEAAEIPAGPQRAAADGEIPLVLHGRDAEPGMLWPFTFGVPFPEGAVRDAERIRLIDDSGEAIPIQVETTGRWFDDSIRWVLIDTQLPLPREQAYYWLEWGDRVMRGPQPNESIQIQESPERVRINTGPLELVFTKKNLSVFEQARLHTESGWLDLFPGGAGSDLYLEDGEGNLFRGSWAEPPEVEIEEEGPLRAVVRIEGWLASEDGRRLGRHQIRVYAYAGRSDVRLFNTFIKTADSEKVTYRNIAMSIPYRGNVYRFLGREMPGSREVLDADYLLQYRHNKFEVVRGESVDVTGERAPGVVEVSEGDTAYTVTRRFFWQTFPAEIEVRPGELYLHFWPRHGKEAEFVGDKLTYENLGHLWWVHEGEELDFRLPDNFDQWVYIDNIHDVIRGAFDANAMGISRTVEYLFDFHGADPGAWERAEAFHANPMMVVDPRWLADSKAFWNIAPRSEHYSDFEDSLERTLQFLPAMYERIGDYGLWNYGAYHQNYHPNLDHARHHRIWKGFHHGGPRWPWLTFARTGNVEHFDFAEIHARHLMDISVVNWEDDDYNAYYQNKFPNRGEHGNHRLKFLGGKNDYKGFVHWHRGNRIGYNAQVDWALWYYYMTGYRRAYETAMNMGEYLLQTFPVPRVQRSGNARGEMATTLYRATQDPRYRELAERQMHHPERGFATVAREEDDYLANIYYQPFVERYWQAIQDESMIPLFIKWAEARRDVGRAWHTRDTWYGLLAMGYHLTGDSSFLQHGLNQARLLYDSRATGVDPILEGVLIAPFGGAPGYTGQQWGDFVRALDAHYEATGERLEWPKVPDLSQFQFIIRAYRGAPDRTLVFHVRREPGETVDVTFPLQSRNKTLARLDGPGGKRIMEEELERDGDQMEFRLQLDDSDPDGDYRVEFHCPNPRGGASGDLTASWPFPGEVEKIVMELPFDQRLGPTGFYFQPTRQSGSRPGTVGLVTSIGDAHYQSHRFYDPEGNLVFEGTEQGGVTGPINAELEIPWGQQGELWLYSGGSTGTASGVDLTGDVLPVITFDSSTFFVPDMFSDRASSR